MVVFLYRRESLLVYVWTDDKLKHLSMLGNVYWSIRELSDGFKPGSHGQTFVPVSAI